jgi:small subunit ribosomal protein S9
MKINSNKMVKKAKNLQYYEGVGRRKEAVALVRLYIAGKDKTVTVKGAKMKLGEVMINGKQAELMFPSIFEKNTYLSPLKIIKGEDRFAITILIRGGGRSGQLDAISLGMARAIEKIDKESYRPILKKAGLFTRDARTRERRKVGTGGKARRKKQSPKR